MFSLFRRKPKKGAEHITAELKRHVIQLQESTALSSMAIAVSMLSFGISLIVSGKGSTGLPSAIEILASLVEEEQAKLGSLGSSIVDIHVNVPQQPPEHHQVVVGKLRDLALYWVDQGYSYEPISAAMVSVAGEIAKLIGKDSLFALAILKKEHEMRCRKYRQQQLQQTASGERCAEESINILLQAEADGFVLTVERDGTFVLMKENVGNHYLRSNADIEQFGRKMKRRKEAEEANRNPVERLVEQGHKDLRKQKLENAIGSYSAALRIKPDSAELYFHRADAWSNTFYNGGRNADDLQKAIDDYTRGIEIDPEYGEAYFLRAGLLSEQGQVAKAIADYGKAIEKGHQVSHSFYCRAHLWQSTGEAGNAKAIADFDEAIRIGDRHYSWLGREPSLTANVQTPSAARRQWMLCSSRIRRPGAVLPFG
jgi:tetratricopeptide (TPR) repeat protein